MNLPCLLADVIVEGHRGGGIGSYSFGEIVIGLIIVVAIIAVAIAITRAMGWEIPSWVWTVVGICIAAVVAILAIRFLMSL